MYRVALGLILLVLTATGAPAAPPADWIGNFVNVKFRMMAMRGVFANCDDATVNLGKWETTQNLGVVLVHRPFLPPGGALCQWYQETGVLIDVPDGEELWVVYSCDVGLYQKTPKGVRGTMSLDVTVKMINRVTNEVELVDVCAAASYTPVTQEFEGTHAGIVDAVCLQAGSYWFTLTSKNLAAYSTPPPPGAVVMTQIFPRLEIDKSRTRTPC